MKTIDLLGQKIEKFQARTGRRPAAVYITGKTAVALTKSVVAGFPTLMQGVEAAQRFAIALHYGDARAHGVTLRLS